MEALLDFAQPLNVQLLEQCVSAVYSVGDVGSEGATVVARKYAHRSMPHVMGIDFTFDNSKGTTALTTTISGDPKTWGTSGDTLSTKDTTWTRSSGADTNTTASASSSSSAGMACWDAMIRMGIVLSSPVQRSVNFVTNDLHSKKISAGG